MNFNLIAKGENQCQDFSVRFREPITINENSQIKLNFVSFQRENVIDFTEDQTITFAVESKYVLPRVLPVSPFAPNTTALNGMVVTIPKGKYSPLSIRNTIETNMEDALDSIASGVTQYVQLAKLDDTQIPELLTFGLSANISASKFAFGADSLLAAIQTVTGLAGSYVKASGGTPGIYDSYALANLKYYHYFEESPNAITQTNTMNILYFRDALETSGAIKPPTGKITVGLYGKSYAVTSGYGSNLDRTNGATLQTFDTQQTVAAFVSWEIDFSQASLPIRIFVAKNNAGERVYEWDTQRNDIDSMEVIYSTNMSAFPAFISAPQKKLICETYYRSEDARNLGVGESPKIYFRIFVETVANADASNYKESVVYDSYTDGWGFKPEFFVNKPDDFEDRITYNTPNNVRGQVPFNIISASQTELEGTSIGYKPFLEFTDTESIIERYDMKFSEQLARCFDKSPPTNRRPNITEADSSGAFSTFLSVNWLEDGYSVFMEGLPIRNFKNKGEQRDGGFAKAILANVPAPFGVTANIVNEAATSDTTALFQPTFPVISNLKNNKITVNSLNIKVVDMDTEVPATHLKKFVANFSITE